LGAEVFNATEKEILNEEITDHENIGLWGRLLDILGCH